MENENTHADAYVAESSAATEHSSGCACFSEFFQPGSDIAVKRVHEKAQFCLGRGEAAPCADDGKALV